MEKDIQMGDEMGVKLWHIKENSMSYAQGVITQGCEIFILMGNLIINWKMRDLYLSII